MNYTSKEKQLALQGIHTFLEHHCPSYNRKYTFDVIRLFYRSIDIHCSKGDAFKYMYISTHFREFRDWWFSLDRERLKFEH